MNKYFFPFYYLRKPNYEFVDIIINYNIYIFVNENY